ncbi:MAG: YdeI/OmpD-associated family protein [Oscillospiraceae bacterium]
MEKTIVEKLNLKKYEKVAVLNMPEEANYLSELDIYDKDLIENSYDLIFAFVLDMDSLRELVYKVIEESYLNKNGYIFLAYPKKGNKVYPTFIHRDDLLGGLGADEEGYVRESNIKFSRMVGLDDIFTIVGLKEDSKSKNKIVNKPSQCVDDYVDNIVDIENDLKDKPELLSFYKGLTEGYRKGWARYVYSSKQEATKEKRREEMKEILGEGYKSRDLYNKDKK